MKATIYIRKENEDWWREFGSSAWVNKKIYENIAPGGFTGLEPPEVREAYNKLHSTCKHGFAIGNCKKGCK